MRKFIAIFAGVAVLIAATIAIANIKPTNYCQIFPASEENGYIADVVRGNKDALVLIYEYGDFQCSTCAYYHTFVNGAIEIAEGNLAVIYRNYLHGYHVNAKPAAAAALAAANQGFFDAYSDQLFNHQTDWQYASDPALTDYFNEYFEKASAGQGDLEKFTADRASENIAKKLAFDEKIGKNLRSIGGTPAFFYENQYIDFSNEKGGEITVKGQPLKWDHALSGDEFAQLLLDIVNIKFQ